MLSAESRRPLVVILGPTAAGKTALAVRLARRLGGEVVSADSRLFYRGMDVGTAKPDAAELAGVPHHLINVADPDERWSLARFQDAAFAKIADIHRRARLPLLVGGTGQYIRSVTEGWQIPRQQPDPALRAALQRWADAIGPDSLHQRLAVLDPEAAAAIDPQNLRRTLRALEVIFHTGSRFSVQRTRRQPRYRLHQLGLTRPRHELYARIDHRIEMMLARGWLNEVQVLLDQGYSPELASFSAIGYRELAEHVAGNLDLEEAVRLIKKRTRQFVRRQANWFKLEDPQIHWIQVGEEPARSIADAADLAFEAISRWLAGEND